MQTLDIRSYEEYMSLKLTKGGLYEIVQRKDPVYGILEPIILKLGEEKPEWLLLEKSRDVICMCLASTPIPTQSRIRTRMKPGTTGTARSPTRMMTPMPAVGVETQWDLWWNSFVRVLYKEKICLVHIGWLERV